MARLLEGKVAVVTGAGRGIGRAHATRLASYGAKVVVNDPGVATDGSPTDERPGEGVVREIVDAGGEAVADLNDISSYAGGEAAVQKALDTWGDLHVLVNNAGIGRPHMVFNMEDAEWEDVIRVHLTGTFSTTRHACRWWRGESKAGRGGYGRIVNTSTGLLLYGGAGQSNYVAAKAGVAAFTDAVATEMAPHGVTANVLFPSASTRLAGLGWRIGRSRARETDFDPTDPLHVAEMVCYLASPEARWLSGQCFQVRGGVVEHVEAWQVARSLERHDAGWTAPELVAELPRMFGAGSKRSDPPPREWSEQYHKKGTPVTDPATTG
jgi:NAD(P)-dependent dehydrogenase (short-subunit alcohol dehydrogenase family)